MLGWDFFSPFIFWRDFVDVSDALECSRMGLGEELLQVIVVYSVPAFSEGFLKFWR